MADLVCEEGDRFSEGAALHEAVAHAGDSVGHVLSERLEGFDGEAVEEGLREEELVVGDAQAVVVAHEANEELLLFFGGRVVVGVVPEEVVGEGFAGVLAEEADRRFEELVQTVVALLEDEGERALSGGLREKLLKMSRPQVVALGLFPLLFLALGALSSFRSSLSIERFLPREV